MCVCLFTVDQHFSNEPLSLSTLDRTPTFTGVCKKKKKKNRLFCRPELEFRSEIFATVAAQFETITSHSPIYLHCVDAQTLHPTCFYPAAVSLEQHLIPHNV